MKIRDRTGIMARHFVQEPEQQSFIEEQVGTLVDSLQLEEAPQQYAEFEQVWGGINKTTDQWTRQYQDFRGPSPLQFRAEFETFDKIYQPPQDWIADYESPETLKLEQKARENLKDLEQFYQPPVAQTETKKQMDDQQLQERLEEEKWFSQFLPNGGKKSLVQQTANKWVEEFTQSNQQETAGGLLDDWPEFESRTQPNVWLKEFEENQAKEDLQDLAQKFSSLQDPKLRNSNFMKFIEKN